MEKVSELNNGCCSVKRLRAKGRPTLSTAYWLLILGMTEVVSRYLTVLLSSNCDSYLRALARRSCAGFSDIYIGDPGRHLPKFKHHIIIGPQ